jgi:hypothetical protein
VALEETPEQPETLVMVVVAEAVDLDITQVIHTALVAAAAQESSLSDINGVFNEKHSKNTIR